MEEVMKRIQSVDDIADAYTKRILSNVIGKDPLKVLSSTPKRLRKFVKGLNKKQLRHKPAADKWSIAQIVAHFADVELVLAWRIRLALAQSGSLLQVMNQDKWAAALKYEKADVDEEVDFFAVLRKRNLAIWRSLSEEEWQNYGMHEERGKETIERIAQVYAGHDINHLNQIEAIRMPFKKKKNIKLEEVL
jgi:hypothetical protein